jgi:putative hemolysin
LSLPQNPLSYAHADMPVRRRLFLRLVEWAHGIEEANRRYQHWRAGFARYRGDAMNRLLAACDISLDIRGGHWPPARDPARPLVLVANHPFGVPDGVAILALAERLGPPVRILINSDLLRIPEMAGMSLPIDFSETREAVRINVASGRDAVERLRRGETIAIFPSGGVATASWPFGHAGDLPWKTFVAKLVHRAQADVLPLYFAGQNSWLFHAASQISMFLRLSLVVPEALRWIGRSLEVYAGGIISYAEMAAVTDRWVLTQMLRRRVFALAPDGAAPDRVGRLRIT